MHFRLRHVLNICFGFFEISQPSYFCFSGCHLNYIFNICFRKFNTSCWKKEHGKVSVTQPHLISCFEYIFKGTYQRYIPANRSASYLKVVDAIFKDLQSCFFSWSEPRSYWIRRDTPYISPYSVRMRENTDLENPEYGHFLRSDILKINVSEYLTTHEGYY